MTWNILVTTFILLNILFDEHVIFLFCYSDIMAVNTDMDCQNAENPH